MAADKNLLRNRLLVAAAVAVILLLGFLLVRFLWAPAVDRDEVRRWNNRGIGQMEQFDYAAAADSFRRVTALAPDWRPGRINLAMALLNTTTEANLDRAIALLEDVLKRHPDDPHAHYNLGVILLYRNQLADAARHFQAVVRADPSDAHTWYHVGVTHPDGRESPEAKAAFARALKLNPYLNAARYALALHPHERDDQAAAALLKEHRALIDANWEDEYRIVYTEMGRYARALADDGTPAPPPPAPPWPMFEPTRPLTVDLAPGTRWAAAADLAEFRARRGAALTWLDFDRDGRPDLFLPAAVTAGGRPRNLLLHNRGAGQFADVTAEWGLADSPPAYAVAVGDFDNDGSPDLLLAGPDRVALYRHLGPGYEDVTNRAGLADLKGACRGCGWVDLDQDGDLDLVLTFEPPAMLAMLNVGEARPAAGPGKPPPPLDARFRRADLPPTGAVAHVAFTDHDDDRDVDLILTGGGRVRPLLNDRLLRFRPADPLTLPSRDWSALLALEVNGDERSDLLAVASDGPPALVRSQAGTAFAVDEVPGPRLRQAVAADPDLDGWRDVVGLTVAEPGKPSVPVLLHNRGGRLTVRDQAFGPVESLPPDLHALGLEDLDGDCTPDLLLWSAGQGLVWRRNVGNGARAVRVELTGRRDRGSNLRTTADAVGAWVTANAGRLAPAVELVPPTTGPGASLLPLTLGVGPATLAEAVRVRWPDGVPQAELAQPTCELVRIVELNRKGTSCPILLAWDGERFIALTDFLGGGALGEWGPDGSLRPPRPEESLRIEGAALKPRGGEYLLKMAEPMDEVMYLDHARLLAIDHPPDVHVFPDERFATDGRLPTQDILAFRGWFTPVAARDHRGTDIREVVRDRDGRTVSGFRPRSWLGFAEDHAVEFEFGPAAGRWAAGDRLYLVLTGWIDYPYPESIYAAHQAGVAMAPPVLERETGPGRWQPVGAIGFPAGLPKTMTWELAGPHPEGATRYRIRTNLQVHWDQIALGRLAPSPQVQVRPLPLTRATLAHRGFMREVPPTRPGEPVRYDDSRTEPVAVTRWAGRLTRTGDVEELMRAADDRFVLCGPGDEVTLAFAADAGPPAGMRRTYVLRTWGYCKDTSPFTQSGGSVGPLPFRAMSRYPYPATEPVPPGLAAYDRRWNTRPMRTGR